MLPSFPFKATPKASRLEKFLERMHEQAGAFPACERDI
jgi:hypothetical protein